MGVCLLEVPTVRSDEVVAVFWVQADILEDTLDFWKELRHWRNLDIWILERIHWNFKSSHGIIAPEIQELQENVTRGGSSGIEVA